MKPDQRLNYLRLLVFFFVIGITVYLFTIRDRISHLDIYGYPGVFLVSLLANATVILPLPGVIITSAMGAVFNPFWVALAAGSGAALGELSGFFAGFSGQAVVERIDWHIRLKYWMKKYGDITILVLALVPNPIFDIAGITAGALKMPLYRFLIWCWLGKVIKMLLFAYGGATLLDAIML